MFIPVLWIVHFIAILPLISYVVFLNTIADTNDNYPVYYGYNNPISKSIFHGNFGGESIVCIHQPINSPFPSGVITELDNSTFSNNEGTSLYLLIIGLQLSGNILFINNTANSGAAMYFEEVHSISFDSADVWFINNTAVQRGGALYFNLVTDNCNVFARPFSAFFINNSATIAGASIYFSIPRIPKYLQIAVTIVLYYTFH